MIKNYKRNQLLLKNKQYNTSPSTYNGTVKVKIKINAPCYFILKTITYNYNNYYDNYYIFDQKK